MAHQLLCPSCKYCRVTTNSFGDLSLEVTHATDSIMDCFNSFSRVEQLSKDNAWKVRAVTPLLATHAALRTNRAFPDLIRTLRRRDGAVCWLQRESAGCEAPGHCSATADAGAALDALSTRRVRQDQQAHPL